MWLAARAVYHPPIATQRAHQDERRVLYEVISTVGSSLELDEVLEAVVRLLSDASAVHACFVYLLEDGGERLVLKAASEPYGRFVDEIALEHGEGLAWWAAERREPGFILDNALEDPRFKHVPELEEEQFQSLLSVPMLGKDGGIVGVITLHTEAPREFTDAEIDFLSTSASLVAGAIENARIYEEMRSRVDELEHLTELGETIARTETVEELLPAVSQRCVALLRARACHLYLLDPGSEELQLQASAPRGADGACIGRARRARPGARAERALGVGRRPARGERRAARAPARRRHVGRRPRARGREPDRGRSEEDRADRAAHGEERDQGLLRAARARSDAARPRRPRGPPRLRPRRTTHRARRGTPR